MPPILVTISGMVGAGKSSCEIRLARRLIHEGVPAVSWRFRTLPCFSLPFRSSGRRPEPGNATSTEPSSQSDRGRGYKRRPLTLATTAGYIGRMAAFRVYRRWRQAAGWTLCNRYFYDNLAHFQLEAPAAQKYLAMLRWFMPRPDLALVFVASPDVIAERRPLYTTEYLEQVGEAYNSLIAMFPELVVVSSDPDQQGHATVDRLVDEMLRTS